MGAITCPFCRTEVDDTVTGCPRCGAEYGVLPGGISKVQAELGRVGQWRAARNSLFITITCLACGRALGSYEPGAMGWFGVGAVIVGVFMAGRCLFNIGRAIKFTIAAGLTPTWHQVMTTYGHASPPTKWSAIRLKDLEDLEDLEDLNGREAPQAARD